MPLAIFEISFMTGWEGTGSLNYLTMRAPLGAARKVPTIAIIRQIEKIINWAAAAYYTTTSSTITPPIRGRVKSIVWHPPGGAGKLPDIARLRNTALAQPSTSHP